MKTSTGKKFIKSFVLFMTFLLFTLVLVESCLRLYKIHFDPMERITHGIYRYDKFVGFTPERNLNRRIYIQEIGLDFILDTNDIGLRGNEPLAPKSPNEYRIIILGDSFTFGIGVESSQTFSSFLEDLLFQNLKRNIKVVNCGAYSYGTKQELKFLESYGLKMKPDMVILAFYENDISDNGYELIYTDGFLHENPRLFFGHTLFTFEYISKHFGFSRENKEQDTVKITLSLIDEMREICKRNGIDFIVLNIPARECTKFFRKDIDSHSSCLPLPLPSEEYIDALLPFEATSEDPYLPEHHLNIYGHMFIAEILAQEIMSRKMIE